MSEISEHSALHNKAKAQHGCGFNFSFAFVILFGTQALSVSNVSISVEFHCGIPILTRRRKL